MADRDEAEELELLRFVADVSSEGQLLIDKDSRILSANPAAASILGFARDELVGMSLLDLRFAVTREDGSPMPAEERPSLRALLYGETRRRVVIGLSSPARAGVLWIKIGAIPFGISSAGGASRALVTLLDITERKEAQDRLTRKVRFLDAVRDYAIRLEDASAECLYPLIAAEARSVFGAKAAGIASYDAGRKALVLQDIAWPEDEARGLGRLVGVKIAKGLAAPVGEEEYRHMMEAQIGIASNMREFSFGKVPEAISDFIEQTLGIGWFRGVVLASRGELFGGLGLAGEKGRRPPEDEEISVFAEITSNAIMRKRAEEEVNSLLEEKELLLHEVHHRIKNNMSTMVSLLSIQSRAIEEAAAREALTDAMGRLQSMSTLYDKLFRAEDLREMSLREYLPTLVWEIVGMFPNGDAIDVETDIDEIRLGVKKLSVVGILVNEIVTNSMKYAFTGRSSGRIRVSARLRKGRVRLGLGDDGVGMPQGIDLDSSKGFGLSLVRILAKQLDAAVVLERRKGTGFSIEFDRG